MTKAKYTRRPLAARYRFQILDRDGFACFYCHASGVPLQVDHVVPHSGGGSNAAWNLAASCVPCNQSKTNTAPSLDVVRAVREAHMGWLIHERTSTYAPCVHCAIPMNLDDWEDRSLLIECSDCNELSCNSYEAGYAQALKNVGVA